MLEGWNGLLSAFGCQQHLFGSLWIVGPINGSPSVLEHLLKVTPLFSIKLTFKHESNQLLVIRSCTFGFDVRTFMLILLSKRHLLLFHF